MAGGIVRLLLLLIPLLMLLIIPFSQAAILSGTVYDLSLQKVPNAVVEINSTPRQVMVARNGAYSFNIPRGAYLIAAKVSSRNVTLASVAEPITIASEGAFVVDLILFDEIGAEDDASPEDVAANGMIEELAGESSNPPFIVWIASALVILAILAVIYLAVWKKKIPPKGLHGENNREEDLPQKGILSPNKTDIGALVELIKKEGGRISQKELRKQIPLSEAKISLMLTELEHKGIVEKIKKGRGNVVIMKT